MRAAYDFNTYKLRDAWFTCDRCGERHRRSRMITEWTGLKVDMLCVDPRPPQMTPPDVWPEGLPFPDARPPQDLGDRLTDETSVMAQNGFAFQGAAGDANNPWHVKNTQQSKPGVLIKPQGDKNQQIGAISPRSIIENPLPNQTGLLEDQVTIRTGPIYPGSIISTFGS